MTVQTLILDLDLISGEGQATALDTNAGLIDTPGWYCQVN